ncbi:ferritin-like domain-containing protein [Crassisporium funariophilum]|nr:ferritin-like domain-containing protein [Crassisporium funariophilum]
MHFTSSLISLVATAVFVSAAPARFYGKRAAADILVFKFADVLEQLESEFYQQALAKFQDSDFVSAGFSSSQVAIEQFTAIQSDEATHSTVLQAALKSFGETPITSCKFNFDSALTDVPTMAATARVVESVGVSAYLGGATLLTDPILLTSAGSILTVEARHQTILNVLSSSGTAIPAAFDFALTPSEVLALAGPFFDGPCDLGIPANPGLALTNTGTVAPGTKLSFSSPAINGSTSTMFCQMMLGGLPNSIPLPFDNCVVPAGINGPVAIWITSDGQPLINNVRDRATTQLVAGPALAFIDTQPQMLGQLARLSPGASGAVSTSTRTISPADASSIIAAATPAPNAPAPNADSGSPVPSPVVTGVSSSVLSAPSGSPSAPPSTGTAGGPNTFVGKSPDGAITVNGWTGI